MRGRQSIIITQKLSFHRHVKQSGSADDGLPSLPSGFSFVIDDSGNYVIDNAGNYVIAETP